MKLQIDPRAGSNKLINKFDEAEVEVTTLPAGDVAFFGNGPEDNVWYIGIEYKTLDDFCGSMKSGRFTGTQLPGMMDLYDICFVLIEGIGFLDRYNGALVKKIGKMSYSMGVQYSGFQNFMTSVEVHSALAGKPCIVKRTISMDETVSTIRATFDWFQKPWEHHTNISKPDRTKMQNIAYALQIINVEPTDPEYPKHVLRKALFQIDRMGWETAGKLADRFATMENLLASPQKDLIGEKVGPTMAERIYRTFHGHPDPEIEAKKRKKK